PSPRILGLGNDNDTQGSSAPFTPPSPMSQHSPINPPDQIPSPYSRVSVSPAQQSQPYQPQYHQQVPAAAPVPGASRRQSLHVPSVPTETYTPPPTDALSPFPGPSVITRPHGPTSMAFPPGQGAYSETPPPGYSHP